MKPSTTRRSASPAARPAGRLAGPAGWLGILRVLDDFLDQNLRNSDFEVVQEWILYQNFMNFHFEGLQEAKFVARLPGRLARPAGWVARPAAGLADLRV